MINVNKFYFESWAIPYLLEFYYKLKLSRFRLDEFLKTNNLDTSFMKSITVGKNYDIKVENGNFYWNDKENMNDGDPDNTSNIDNLTFDQVMNLDQGNFDNNEKITQLAQTENKPVSQEQLLEIKKNQAEEVSTKKQPKNFKLSNINVEIKQGELVFILGQSGSGKTSFVQSLFGEMHLKKNQDRSLGKSKVYINDSISYLSQEPFILPTSIRENVVMDQEEDLVRLEWALKYSALKEDIEKMNCTIELKIGTKGSSLSGGQIVRLAFARNLYRNSSVYILDDLLKS